MGMGSNKDKSKQRKFSYHYRLFTLMMVFTLAVIACFTVFQYNREKMFKAELINGRLQFYNSQILSCIANGKPIEYSVNSVVEDNDSIRVTIISNDGNVIYDTFTDTITTNHLNRPEVKDASRWGVGYISNRYSTSTNQNFFYSALSGEDYIVRSALPYSVSLTEVLSADKVFLWFMIIVTIVLTVIAYFVTRRLGSNITRLNEFAKKVERGDSIEDIENFSHDELGDISKHIIHLYASLQQTTADRDREHAAALHEQQEKVRIKKLLTNNINHELKTPITAILGYLETIVNTPNLDPERRDSFLRNCYNQACRLQSLLMDVATITRMDETKELVKIERIDLNDVVSEVVSEMELRTGDQRLRINCSFDSAMIIYGDYSLVSSIFRNLAYNASSYSGGRDIFVNLKSETDTYYTISFADNGIGVDQEHLNLLFERFYRIDKGRSRKDGGTGLGLSIVKNAVLLHGGQISVRNRAEGGLEFIFSLRKKS